MELVEFAQAHLVTRISRAPGVGSWKAAATDVCLDLGFGPQKGSP